MTIVQNGYRVPLLGVSTVEQQSERSSGMPSPARLVKVIVLASPLLLAGLTLLRLHQAADWNIALTRTMLGVVDQPELLLTTLLGSIPFLSLATIGVSSSLVVQHLLLSRGRTGELTSARRWGPRSRWAVAALAVSITTLMLMVPAREIDMVVMTIAAAVSVTITMVLVQRRSVPHSASGVRRAAFRVLSCIALWVPVAGSTIVLLCGALFAVPLYTGEQVVTRDAVYDDAWVVGEQGGWTLLMNDRQDSRWVSTDSIRERHICSGTPGTAGAEPLPRLLESPRTPTKLRDYTPCAR